MDCCKIPNYVLEKVDGVRKELKLKKLNKVMRVAAELSWSRWKEEEVVEKLYPEFARIEKGQSGKIRSRLEKIARSLTRQLKVLSYNFPPPDTFCSLHRWSAKDVSAQRTMQQCPGLKRTRNQQFSQEISSTTSQSSSTTNSNCSDEDVVRDSSEIQSHSSLSSSPISKRIKSIDRIVEDLVVNTPVSVRESTTLREFPVELPSVSESRQVADELVVHYDSHDAEVTANLLAFLTSTFIDWSVISDIFSNLVIHALHLRASRLTTLYNKKCAQVGMRIENIEPMAQSKTYTLQEDRATVSNILAKFDQAYQTLLDVFNRHLALIDELHSLPEEVSLMTSVPITVQWNIPSSLSLLERMKCRGEWGYFQSLMQVCSTQIQQAPMSLETVEMLKEVPKLIKDKSPVVLEHPQVRDWLDNIHRLVEAIHSRNDRKAEVKVTVNKLRDYDRRSREALEEIKRKLAELWKCDHQLGIIRARSEARFKASCVKNQLLKEQRNRLLKEVHDFDVRIAREEYDTKQEYTFGLEKCVAPWTFPQVVNLLEPIVVDLACFVQQEFGSENLENLLKERVEGNIRFLVQMVGKSQAVEVSTMVAGESKDCEMVS